VRELQGKAQKGAGDRRVAKLAAAVALLTGTVATVGVATGHAAPAPSWEQAKQAALASFTPPPPATVQTTPGTPLPYASTEMVTATVHGIGPNHDTNCTIKGELLVPNGVSAAHQAPVVLTTNGFGGSYNDSTTLGSAENAAYDGFVALTYSGLGFGGSSCAIELDSQAWDGAAASQLISWLGTLPEVTKDDAAKMDPRLGMIGGSYGGSIQFATASIDPRVDAIVPVITWNDLAYSLAPNNETNGTSATRRTDAEPGALKYQWTALFFGDGLLTPAEYNQLAQDLAAGNCGGFDPAICAAFARTASLGYPDPQTTALLHTDSMVSYYKSVHLPVLLAQGEDDSLFNMQEAVRNMRELQANGDPVQLVLQSWGHSHSTPAAGELSYTAPFSGYENTVIKDFYDKYLLGQAVSTGPAVQYFRPWVSYSGNAAPAYGSAPSWPVAPGRTLYLSGGGPGTAGTLTPSAKAVTPGSQSFANTGPTGSSYSETSGVQDQAPFSSIPPSDTPGTFASFETAPLTTNTDVVGIPSLTVHLTSAVPAPAPTSPATDPVVYAKLYDVSPSGSVTLADRLVSPVRVTDTSKPVTITLPGIVNRFAAGDRLELVLASGDDAYLGNRTAETYTVTVTPGAPGCLQLPIVAANKQDTGGASAAGLP
jgi:putative CocE/NonD family hydrolase